MEIPNSAICLFKFYFVIADDSFADILFIVFHE